MAQSLIFAERRRENSLQMITSRIRFAGAGAGAPDRRVHISTDSFIIQDNFTALAYAKTGNP
jgi:hypothetical protein